MSNFLTDTWERTKRVAPMFRHNASTKVGGTLECPWCDKTRMREVDRQPPDRVYYRCKDCNKLICYISTPMTLDEKARMLHPSEHPYAHHKQGLGKSVSIPGVGTFRIKR